MSSMERVFFIDRSIKEFGKVTIKEIADQFEVSTKTAERDIDVLRKKLEAPIVFSKEKRGYIYDNPFDLFDFADEKMILFYVFLSSISKGAVPMIPVVSDAILDKIAGSLSKKYLKIRDFISYEVPEYENMNISLAATVLRSMSDRSQIVADYIDSAGNPSQRIIEPLYFLNYSGKWYVIAFCLKYEEMRTFSLSRISSLRIVDRSFQNKIAESEVLDFVKNCFGIFKSQERELVTIRFHEPICSIIETQIWHKEQCLKKGKGYIDMTLPVADYTEIIGKTLFYLPFAEPVKPGKLRKLWLEKLEMAKAKFLEK